MGQQGQGPGVWLVLPPTIPGQGLGFRIQVSDLASGFGALKFSVLGSGFRVYGRRFEKSRFNDDVGPGVRDI